MSPRTAALIEDVEFLISVGCGWREICARTGKTSSGLERLLRLHHRTELHTQARSQDWANA